MADTCACHHTTCAPHILNDLCMHRRHGSQVSRAEAPLAPERRRKMLRHTPCTDCAATSACCCCRHTLCFGCAAVRARTCCRQAGHAARQVPIALLWPPCRRALRVPTSGCLGRHSAEVWLILTFVPRNGGLLECGVDSAGLFGARGHDPPRGRASCRARVASARADRAAQ